MAQTLEISAIGHLEKGAYVLFGKYAIDQIAKSKLLDGLEAKVDQVMA